MIELHEVTYGPDCPARMRALLGDDYTKRNIDNDIYLQPSRAAYALAGGRFAIVTTTTYGFSNRVSIYPDAGAYRRAWDGHYDAMPDPETGRARLTSAR